MWVFVLFFQKQRNTSLNEGWRQAAIIKESNNMSRSGALSVWENLLKNSTGNLSGPEVLSFCILSIISSAEKGNSSSSLIAYIIEAMDNGSKKLSIRDLSMGGSDLYRRE